MKPIYFPFTYIPESVAEPLTRFLGPAVVLQPVLRNQPEVHRRLEENGRIKIRVPYTDDEDRLVACAAEFKEWGRLHQGDEASLKDIFKGGFSNNAFTAQTRSDILKYQENVSLDPDPVFLARLFLLMAQELDMQQSEVDRELALSIDDEMVLFTSMTGEEKILDPPKESLFKNDYGEYMTGSRITAWFRLMKNLSDESAFLVTNSRSVLDTVLQKIPDLKKVCCLDGISLEQPETVINELNQCIEILAATPWTGTDSVRLPGFISGTDNKLNFKLYILPEADLQDVCNIFSGDKYPSKQNENKRLNTLIGFFEI